MKPTTRIDENGRVCTRCHEYKLWSEFDPRCDGVNGCKSRCRECLNEDARRYNKEYGNEKSRNEKHGLLFGQFEKMVKEQNYKCKICGCVMVLEAGKSNSVKVDHKHKTGKVRGLLCNNCNLWLGACKENVCALARAIIYIKNEGEI